MLKTHQGGREMLNSHSWRTASLLIALTVIVGLALPALGDDGRPFSGHADEVIISAEQVGAELLVTAPGEGQATHLGQFTRLGNVVINLVDGSVKGTVVFTAANGDQLFADIEGCTDGFAYDRRWYLHIHWGDRPVQRRVGNGGVCGSYCVRWYSYHRRVRGHHTVLRGRTSSSFSAPPLINMFRPKTRRTGRAFITPSSRAKRLTMTSCRWPRGSRASQV